jgi:hypothetical protein
MLSSAESQIDEQIQKTLTSLILSEKRAKWKDVHRGH